MQQFSSYYDTPAYIQGQIIAYRRMNMSYLGIAEKIEEEEKFKLSKTTVFNIWQRKLKDDLQSHRSNCGRKHAMEVEEEHEIIEAVKEDRSLSTNTIAMNPSLNTKGVSRQTINNILIREGLFSHPPIKKNFISDINKQKRLQFAKQRQTWTENWKKIVFSDESWFYVDDNRLRFVRRYNGEILTDEYSNSFTKFKNPNKIMMWATISFNEKRTMQFIEGSLDSTAYRKILIKNFPHFKELLNGEWYFQQDNARPHVAKQVINYLENKKIKILEWPPQSPDLSPIENIWSILKDRIFKLAENIENIEEMKQKIETYFYSDGLNPIIQECYLSLQKRMKLVIERDGDCTGY